MNIVYMPLLMTLALTNLNGSKTFSWNLSSAMSWLGVVSSMLTSAAIFGIPMFFFSPVWIIYSMINVIPSTSSWANYTSYFTSYLS